MSFFYLCSCLSTQFLYRTAVKATFNVKENIKDNIKNSITLIINITTSPTIFRKIQVAKPHLFLVISYANYFTISFLFCLQYLQTFTIYSCRFVKYMSHFIDKYTIFLFTCNLSLRCIIYLFVIPSL